MPAIVLDASALLAFLNGEAGAERVIELLPDACISAVNLSEVMAKLVEKGIPAREAAEILASLPLDILPADHALALRAGALRLETRAFGLSLGDRFCLALAEREGKPALTADKSWEQLSLGIEVVLVR